MYVKTWTKTFTVYVIKTLDNFDRIEVLNL